MARFFKVADIDLIDLDKLVRMLPGNRSCNVVRNLNRGRYVTAMLRSWETLDEAGVNNARRLAHFIG